MIRVVVVDDHTVVREGLVGMLQAEEDLEVVGQAGDGDQAVELAWATRPDVILMDLRMPGLGGVWATRQITSKVPDSQVLVLTTYSTDSDILRAVEAGATGYLLKDVSRVMLAEAVRSTARGETVLSQPVAARIAARSGSPLDRLTQRETDVLSLVAEGASNREAAEILAIGEATVKSHLQHVFTKLGVSDRTAAVTTAMAMGLIATP